MIVPEKHKIVPGSGREPMKIPVLTFLIDHPKGLVLVDTGLNPSVWPDEIKNEGTTNPDLSVEISLDNIGYSPNDIDYVVMSHLHMDHTGWMTAFPNATFILRLEELKWAWWPDNRNPGAGGYVFNDYKSTRNFIYIELLDDQDYDIFGDGTLICIDTKGHTRGHQSLIINLPEAGCYVLAIDAAIVEENYRNRTPPGEEIWNLEWALRAYDRFNLLEKKGAKIIYGHDPVQSRNLKYSPRFYK